MSRLGNGKRHVEAQLPASEVLEPAYATIIEWAEGAEVGREGLERTPARAARAWRELTCGYRSDVDLTTFDADGYDEMIVVANIPLFSICEHHLLPFHGLAHIAYLPATRILGLSKFARLVNKYARRLQVQERLTMQIADELHAALEPVGVMVVVEAEHLCMTMRGVQTPGSRTTTSVTYGSLRDKPEARAEALALIRKETR